MTTYWVGESGPEYISFPKGGTVIPNDVLRAQLDADDLDVEFDPDVKNDPVPVQPDDPKPEDDPAEPTTEEP